MGQINNNIKNGFKNLIENITFFSIELIKILPYILVGTLFGFLTCILLDEYSMYGAVIFMGLSTSPEIYGLLEKSE